jgi:hypothetical protein
MNEGQGIPASELLKKKKGYGSRKMSEKRRKTRLSAPPRESPTAKILKPDAKDFKT